MIGWLKGEIIQIWHLSSREGVVISVGGLGYEVQLLSKQISVIDNSKLIELWIHEINREECRNLYGFEEVTQRDLFRRIIGITGIGPQIALTLLEDHSVSELVEAIQQSDITLISKSKGIGKRIAERLVLELKNKLHEFKNNNSITNEEIETKSSKYLTEYLEEIKSTLNSLGYLDNEIKASLDEIRTNEKNNIFLATNKSTEAKSELIDEHLKEILLRLSQKST
tara:strand:+ start:1430 stop:2104 length:675 start_codon:yes stop_codon:yes gene_type:complete